MGWEFVAEWKEFLIYRCDDANLPELNTDPAVQALSFKRVQNALADRVFRRAIICFYTQSCCFFCSSLRFARRSDGWDHSVSGAGPGYHRADVGRGARLAQAARLRRHLQSGGRIEHTDGWREEKKRCLAGKIIRPILTAVWPRSAC